MRIYPTPRDLIGCVGYLDAAIRLKPSDENEWELRNNKKLLKKSIHPLAYLYNFIMNNISSMIYLNKNSHYKQLGRVKESS
jgi:hypothetical protein